VLGVGSVQGVTTSCRTVQLAAALNYGIIQIGLKEVLNAAILLASQAGSE
jgi:hypothetical protein